MSMTIATTCNAILYLPVVSAAMKILNATSAFAATKPVDAKELADHRLLVAEATGILLRLLAPITPHITHALWQELAYVPQHGEIVSAPWPQVDEAALVQDEIELMLQVAGKLRGSIRVPAAADRHAIEAAALATPEFAKFGEGRAAKKVIIVAGRLVNVVV